MLISVSATTKPRDIKLVLTRAQSASLVRPKNISVTDVNTIVTGLNPLFKTTTIQQVLPLLRKVGINNVKEFFSFLNVYYKQSAATKSTFADPLLLAAIKIELAKHNISTEVPNRAGVFRSWRSRPKRTKSTTSTTKASASMKAAIADILFKTYSFIAYKLCPQFKIPVADMKHLVLYMLFGKSSVKVPAKFKKALPLSVVSDVRKVDVSTTTVDPALAAIGLFDLTIPLIKKWGSDLVSRIPDMVATELKGSKKTTPKAKTSYYNKPKMGMRTRLIASRAVKAKSVDSLLKQLDTKLHADVSTFVKLQVPALRKIVKTKSTKDSGLDKLKSDFSRAKSELAGLNRRVIRSSQWSGKRPSGPRGAYFTKPRQSTIDAAKQALKAATEALKAAKAKPDDNGGLVPKPWMLPFLDATVSVNVGGRKARVLLGDGVLTHRLITRANKGSLAAGNPELSAVIDTHNAALLTLDGIDTIINRALGGNSITAFKTVFKECADFIKPKAYAMGMFKTSGSAHLDTAIGKVSNKRLLKLNNVTTTEIHDFETDYAKEITAWNPLKQKLADALVVQSNAVQAKGSKLEVTAATKAELTAWRADAQKYIAGIHNVGVEVMKAWSVKQSKQVTAVLKNTAKSSKLKVVTDVFHGCPKQTAGVILTYGFKISGTKTNGRSMGNVLYVAPNIDKSAQYLGTSFTRKKGVTGVIFMGDCLVSGTPTSMRRSSSEGRASYAWTKTSGFATQEIGLVSPNAQFVIRRVYLVKVTDLKGTKNSARTRFNDPIGLQAYAAKLTSSTAVDTSTTGRRTRKSKVIIDPALATPAKAPRKTASTSPAAAARKAKILAANTPAAAARKTTPAKGK